MLGQFPWDRQHYADLIEMLEQSGVKSVFLDVHMAEPGQNADSDAAMADVMSKYDKTVPSIVLSHNPDVCDLNVWNNYKGWILSGHTHGGQCKPPFLPPPMLPVKNKKYTAGKVLLSDERTLYINRALGHLWQVRFNVRPEITIFTLQNA